MFRSLVISKKRKVQKLSLGFVILSLGVHFSVICLLTVNEYLEIPIIHPPSVQVTFIDAQPYIPPSPPSRPAPSTSKVTNSPGKKSSDNQIKLSAMNLDSLIYSRIPDDIDREVSPRDDILFGFGDLVIGGIEGSSGPGGLSTLYPNPDQPKFIALTGDMTRPDKIYAPPPKYPVLPREAGISCSVTVEAKIDINGTVIDISILESCPVFQEQFERSVREALHHWKFKPALLNGIPVPVRYTLTINFHLH